MINSLGLHRVLMRYTRKAVAEKIGVNPITIWRWETDKTIPPADKIWQFCALYECKPADIFPEWHTFGS